MLADPVPGAEHGLARDRPEQDHEPGPDDLEFRGQPVPAGPDLRPARTLVNPALTALGPLEVLDRVGQVHAVAAEAGFGQRPVEDPARRAGERTALLVLLVAWLLSHQRDFCVGRAFAEDGPRRALVQAAPRAALRLVPEFLPAR